MASTSPSVSNGPTASSTRSPGGRSFSSAVTGASIRPAVGADDPERPAAERQTDVAGARRVDDAPALDLAGGDRHLRLGGAVDQAHVAFAAVVAVHQTAGLRDPTGPVDAQIV